MPPDLNALLNATVTERKEINHGLLVLQITPDQELVEFTPRQYAVLGLPGTAPRSPLAEPEDPLKDPAKLIRRAYSVASSSKQRRYLEFYVALVHDGALTPRLFALQEGDRVWLGKKIVGMFTLEDAPADNDLIFAATGTGLAPYLSMLRSAYQFDASRKTVVCHASRVSWDLGYRSDLEALAARYENFHYLPIISEPELDPGWQGDVGFVNGYVDDGSLAGRLGHELTPDSTSVFLCGNPLMVKGMETILGERGFRVHSRKETGSIFVEKYWAQE